MKLTKSEIRIKVAELCGYTDIKQIGDDGSWRCVGDAPGSVTHSDVPNYPEDLNACSAMEASLTEDQCDFFQGQLTLLCVEDTIGDYPAACYYFHSTAMHRCLAFLRTHGIDAEVSE